MLTVVKYKLLLSVLLATMLLIPNIVTAASTGLTASPINSPALLKMLLGLASILLLIFFLAFLSRKMKLLKTGNQEHQIKNLATMPLTTREKISLIEVGGKQLLIGIAPGRINMLHVFEQPIESESDSGTVNVEHSFSNQFKKALGLASLESKPS